MKVHQTKRKERSWLVNTTSQAMTGKQLKSVVCITDNRLDYRLLQSHMWGCGRGDRGRSLKTEGGAGKVSYTDVHTTITEHAFLVWMGLKLVRQQ